MLHPDWTTYSTFEIVRPILIIVTTTYSSSLLIFNNLTPKFTFWFSPDRHPEP